MNQLFDQDTFSQDLLSIGRFAQQSKVDVEDRYTILVPPDFRRLMRADEHELPPDYTLAIIHLHHA